MLSGQLDVVPGAERRWLALPLLTLAILACSISLMSSGRLTLRLVAPAMVYASFVPLLQILSVALVRGRLPWRRAVALFFRGHYPWSAWLLLSAAAWGLFPAREVYRFSYLWEDAALVALAWSAWIDYRFFRKSVAQGRREAILRLAVQRAICWIPGALLFVAPAGWQVVASAVGL